MTPSTEIPEDLVKSLNILKSITRSNEFFYLQENTRLHIQELLRKYPKIKGELE